MTLRNHLLTSVFFPTWLWVRHPEERLVFASYSAALAVRLSVDRRAVIQSQWYQGRWGSRVRMAGDANLKSEFQNAACGHMIATSVGASITGKGGNYVIADDLINPGQADSELEREGAIRWFDETLGSRLDSKQTGRIVVIEQRTHQADLTGHLLTEVIASGKPLRLSAGVARSDEFLTEVCAFPAGPHDDQVDALTQAIGYLGGAGQHMGFRNIMRSEAIVAVAQAQGQAAAAERYGLDPIEVDRIVSDREDGARDYHEAYMAAKQCRPRGEPLNCRHCGLPLGRMVYNSGLFAYHMECLAPRRAAGLPV
jgi:hypothetical protein